MKRALLHILTAAVAVTLLQAPDMRAGSKKKAKAGILEKRFAELVKIVESSNDQSVKDYLIKSAKEVTSYSNKFDESGKPILTIAIMFGNSEKTIKLLLLSGADVNAPEKVTGDTPLHRAVGARKIPVMEMLLKFNADINAENKSKQTPLDIAVELNNLIIMKDLIKAAWNTANKETIDTAIKVAQTVGYKNIEKMLQKYLLYRTKKLSDQALLKYLDDINFR